MGRLTRKKKLNIGTAYGKLSEYTSDYAFSAIVERLAIYENAEENRRLTIFPETLSASRIDYIRGIIAKQIEYAEAEAALATSKQGGAL